MTAQENELEPESLGQLLRKTRIARGRELNDIINETKISGSNLKAMEADDYGSLPADAFAKGFYALYAKLLKLDPDEIVARFLAERGSAPRKRDLASHTPETQKAAQKVSSMAEPSSVSPVSTFGFILLLMIIIGAGFCWFFNINPATFISEKLRSIQQVDSPDTTPSDADTSFKQQSTPWSSISSITPSEKISPKYADLNQCPQLIYFFNETPS